MKESSTCKGPECARDSYCKGLCSAHYYQQAAGKPMLPLVAKCDYPECGVKFDIKSGKRSSRCPEHKTVCGVLTDGAACGRQSRRPTCAKHRHRIASYGDPGPAEGRLRRRKYPEPAWRKNSQGYIYKALSIDGKRVQLLQHREIVANALGRPLLPEENVHHINGMRDDNRPENLELWSSSQPPGQRVEDKVQWAKELLALYAPDLLR